MIYLDTSFLAPIYIAETTSDRIENLLLNQSYETLAISHWTRVEFASLVARRLRMQELSAKQATTILETFEKDAKECFETWQVESNDFEQAIAFLNDQNTGLRAGDALHLAIAFNHNTQEIWSLDRGLIAAANRLGLTASSAGMT